MGCEGRVCCRLIRCLYMPIVSMSARTNDRLRVLLRSANIEDRVLAAEELAKCRGDSEALVLLWNLMRDREKRVREAAADAISEHGEAAIPLLKKGLDDTDWIIRYRSVEALGKVGGEKAIDLIAGMLQDENDHVKYMAAKSLTQRVPGSAVRLLERCLQDENPYVRRAAAMALATCRTPLARRALAERLELEASDEIRRLILMYLEQERPY